MRIQKLALALAFAGSTAFAGLIYAESPSSTVKLDDKMETPEVQHLRAARKSINEAKDAFEKDPADAKGHRKEILEGIDKALVAIDAEIDELKEMK